MDTSMLGMKDFYDVQLKAQYPVTINGITYQIGEPFAVFDSIQSGDIEELRKKIDAKGGYGNQSLVSWDTTKEVHLNFRQGVLSKTHLALLGNSAMQKEYKVEVPKIEHLEIDENYKVKLRFLPIEGTLYVYNENTGEKITDYILEDDIITFNNIEMYTDIQVIYEFEYVQESQAIIIGERLINGYVELTGKTRLRDDSTGQEYTGIIRIPRLRIVSDLSMRLGKDVTPVIGNFSMIGYPTGTKGNEKVMDFIILSNDIDTDI